MKYGESAFDILYLIFAIATGIYIMAHRRDREDFLMGLAAIVLGAGDAFHLVPRVLNYYIDGDFTVPLGAGKFVTSLTMTLFYLFVYHIYLLHYGVKEKKTVTVILYGLAVIRIILCLLPQNNWLENESSVTWGIIRNIPFVIMGAIIVVMFFRSRNADRVFRNIWLYILLSFLFYIPVAVAASLLPMLGMLMLPKTVCYILILVAFIRRNKLSLRE